MILMIPESKIQEFRNSNQSKEILKYKGTRNIIYLNFCSLYPHSIQLNLLFNISQERYDQWREGNYIDKEYASWILGDYRAFMEFMKIIYPLYYLQSTTVVIIYQESPLIIDLTESLSKLIQQRYGIITNYVYEINDLMYIEDSTPTVPGLSNFDKDKETYTGLCDNMNVNTEFWMTPLYKDLNAVEVI